MPWTSWTLAPLVGRSKHSLLCGPDRTWRWRRVAGKWGRAHQGWTRWDCSLLILLHGSTAVALMAVLRSWGCTEEMLTTMMMIMTIMMTMMLIILFLLLLLPLLLVQLKGAVLDFHKSNHYVSDCLQHAAHKATMRCMNCRKHSSATWCKRTAQLLNVTGLNSIYLILAGHWNQKLMTKCRKQKHPQMMSSRKCPTLKPQRSTLTKTRTFTLALVTGFWLGKYTCSHWNHPSTRVHIVMKMMLKMMMMTL